MCALSGLQKHQNFKLDKGNMRKHFGFDLLDEFLIQNHLFQSSATELSSELLSYKLIKMNLRSYYVEMPSLIRYLIFLFKLAPIALTLQRQPIKWEIGEYPSW